MPISPGRALTLALVLVSLQKCHASPRLKVGEAEAEYGRFAGNDELSQTNYEPTTQSPLPTLSPLSTESLHTQSSHINVPHAQSYNARRKHDVLNWVWIDESSLELSWPSRFSLSLNGVVTAYRLSLNPPHRHQPPIATTTMYHPSTLQHQFQGLASNLTYKGRLVALVGQHHWPYTLLNFTLDSPKLSSGGGLRTKRPGGPGSTSTTADLTSVRVGVKLRWSPLPFLTDGSRAQVFSAGVRSEASVSPVGYRLTIWDQKHMLTRVATSITDHHNGCEATLRDLRLDTLHKVTIEALQEDHRPGTSMTFTLDSGGFHVAGGGRTTDGVSECYSGLQVRCPGSERCVSPYWICDGAPDCPDGVDEVGCDASPCDGFRCWDDLCIPNAWRCDGHLDCKEGDDEYGCPECSSEELPCLGTGGACVPLNQTCDDHHNCVDGWDESRAVCGRTECGPGEVECGPGGTCLAHHRFCDQIADCPDAEDENPVLCSTVKSFRSNSYAVVSSSTSFPCLYDHTEATLVNCTENQFRCVNEQCIARRYLCNGFNDCVDGDDETPEACSIAAWEAAMGDHQFDVTQIEATGEEEPSCEERHLCPSGECVDSAEMCSGEEHLCLEGGQGGNCTTSLSTDSVLPDAHVPETDDDFVDFDDDDISNNLIIEAPPTSTAFHEDDRGDEIYSSSEMMENQIHSASEIPVMNLMPVTEADGFGGAHNSSSLNDQGLQNTTQEEMTANKTDTSLVFDDISFDSIDVSVEVDIEGSGYPGAIDSDEETINISENKTMFDSLDYSVDNEGILISSTATEDSVMSTPSAIDIPNEEFDFNATSPYITTDTSSEESNEYGLSSSEEFGIQLEVVNASVMPLPVFESVNTTKVLNSTDLSSSEEDFSSEEIEEDYLIHNVSIEDFPSTEDTSTSPSNTKVDSEVNATASDHERQMNMNQTQADQTTESLKEMNWNMTSTENEDEITTTTTITSPQAATDVSVSESFDNTTRMSSSDFVNITDSSDVNDTVVLISVPDDGEMTSATPAMLPTENGRENAVSTTQIAPQSDVTTTAESTGHQISSTSAVLTTEPDNWKDLTMEQQNLTILIAVHSEMNESKIPQYIIHGLDGSTYEYEIVSISKEDKKNAELQKKTQEEEVSFEGPHEISYLQGNLSGAARQAWSCAVVVLVMLVHRL